MQQEAGRVELGEEKGSEQVQEFLERASSSAPEQLF